MHKTNQPQTATKSQGRDAAIQITCNREAIKSETIDGVTYYSTTRRGVAYTAYQTKQGDWFVATKRLALGRFNAGGGRYYKTIGELAQAVKAFAGLDLLIQEL